MPINFTVQQLLGIGPQIIQVGGGVRYWAESSAAGLVTGVPETVDIPSSQEIESLLHAIYIPMELNKRKESLP
jgi:hypothetical protein